MPKTSTKVRSTKRVTFDTREAAMAALQKAIQGARKPVKGRWAR
jgi:hypothetical protein